MSTAPAPATDPGVTKAWARAFNSFVTLILAAVAFSVMANNVDAGLTNGTASSTPFTVVWGAGAIALCVAVPRAFTTLWPGGRKRIVKWVPAVLIAVVGSLFFRNLMDVPWGTCILALLTYVGPIGQDLIDG